MNCQEAEPFVSALHDGETVPKEAAEHIGTCPACQERLHQYAQMGTELRLLASASSEEAPTPLPAFPPQGWRWARPLTARVLVPRFALALGVIAITGLLAGFGLMWVQASGPWFQFDVTSPESPGGWGSQVQAGYRAKGPGFLMSGPNARLAAMIDVLEIQNDLVRLSVKARRLQVAAVGQEAGRAPLGVQGMPKEKLDQMLANTPAHEYQYVPGQKLDIPVEGGGTLVLTGRVLQRPARFWGLPAQPKPDEIVLAEPVLIRDGVVLAEKVGSASAGGDDPYVVVYAGDNGLYVFSLKPVEGAVGAEAEYGQARFKLDGHDLTVSSATPITGGEQPRQIWVYHDPNYPRSKSNWFSIASGSGASEFVEKLRK